MTAMRTLIVVMLACSVAAVVYVGVTGQCWPLSFVVALLVGSLVIGGMVLAGDYLGRKDD